MDSRLRRAADHERKTGRAFGSRRTARIGSRVAEPDVAPIEARGLALQPECKATKRAPKVITKGLAQARRYNRRAAPVVVIREFGGGVYVALELAAFLAVAGIEASVLPTKHTATRRDPKQLGLPLDVDAPSALTRENACEAAASPSLAPSRVEGGTGAEKGDADGCEDRRRRGAREEPRRHGT